MTMRTRKWINRLAYRLHLKRRPAVGLLQFLPSTFAANAEYSANIYDPESQMQAWHRYMREQARP